jgi:electron transfer flavoprotein alpha subunit
VAINTDRNARFFQKAHLCVVADLKQFLPVLIEKVQAFRDSC